MNHKSDNQRLTELLGGCWHEWMDTTEVGLRCTCRIICGNLDEHIKKSNPTYQHADEVLNLMQEKLGEEKFDEFLETIGIYHYAINTGSGDYYIQEYYILNVPAIVQKTIEFLEKEK
jgi:hypothetical protein